MTRLFSLNTTAFTLVAFMVMAIAPHSAHATDFQQWLAELRVDAQKRGISDEIFDAALNLSLIHI